MTELLRKRLLFTKLFARLVLEAESEGILCAMDQVKRTQAEANANAAAGTGIVHSLHLLGLAGDLLLFDSNGVYLNGDTAGEVAMYEKLGEWWKAQDPLACWGGDFASRDLDHFSITHNGIK